MSSKRIADTPLLHAPKPPEFSQHLPGHRLVWWEQTDLGQIRCLELANMAGSARLLRGVHGALSETELPAPRVCPAQTSAALEMSQPPVTGRVR